MTRLEQVARALAANDGNIRDWPSYDKAARAAVEALRELSDYQSDVLAAKDMMWMNVDSKFIWQTFIDAILNERP